MRTQEEVVQHHRDMIAVVEGGGYQYAGSINFGEHVIDVYRGLKKKRFGKMYIAPDYERGRVYVCSCKRDIQYALTYRT